VLKDLLTVLDNFERALSSKVSPDNFSAFKQGVEMTAADLKNVLQKNGVSEVSAEGLPFDPAVHEALSSEPTEKVEPGHILRVFQKAYKLHDKLIRPAQVVVAKSTEQ
jgi:molecular chaperone GrpE